MRFLLGNRCTYAVVLVAFVLVCVVIGALRGDGDDSDAERPAAPSIHVSPTETPTRPATTDDAAGGPAYPTAVAPSHPALDTGSGLPIVRAGELPPEATGTIALIHAGGPFPYDGDGETFLNSDGLLPEQAAGYYRVYTVETRGSAGPTQRRIVSGTDGELYWTDDLYGSFWRIEE